VQVNVIRGREIGERFGAHNACIGTIPNCYAPSISQTCRFHTVSRPFDATNCGCNNSARRVGSHFDYFVGIAAVPPVSARILRTAPLSGRCLGCQALRGLADCHRLERLSLLHHLLQSSAASRFTAGVSGFLLLMRWSDRPEI
jgi:hypothetical protein